MDQLPTRYEKDMVYPTDYRLFIGGFWEEVGDLQLTYMKNNGLKPSHKFIDVGCGALRGGRKFIDYLDSGNYFAIDRNQSLIDFGLENELNQNLKEKITNNSFIVSNDFNFDFDNIIFDFGIAFSVFIHLKKDEIVQCLTNLYSKFDNGSFFANVFICEDLISPIQNYDVFCYSYQDIQDIARETGWSFDILKIDHPNAINEHKMLRFYKTAK